MTFYMCASGKTVIQSNFKNILKLSQANFHSTPVTYLYSSASLGIDNYLQTRSKTHVKFASYEDKFRTKMKSFVSDEKNMIFTEDLKNMVHIAEAEDLDLVTDMIRKFNSQSGEFRFGSFVFGPVVMRMFHYMDMPDQALKCYEDPANSVFFEQQSTQQILLDLLYKHEKYEEIYRVFEQVKLKQINMTKYPKYSVVLVMAACYKQNTKQSLEYASRLWSEMTESGSIPLRRACTLFAALALNQNAPHVAMEVISGQKQHYVTIRNIKAIALADMGRADDALPVLRSVLEIDQPDQKDKHTFLQETVSRVKSAVEKSNNKNLQHDFDNIEKALKDRNLIDAQTLDKLLTQEIAVSRTPQTTQPYRRLPYGDRQRQRDAY